METILQNLTMVDSGKAKVNHPLVVALGSRGQIIQTFLTVEGHTVPINRDGLITAVDCMFKFCISCSTYNILPSTDTFCIFCNVLYTELVMSWSLVEQQVTYSFSYKTKNLKAFVRTEDFQHMLSLQSVIQRRTERCSQIAIYHVRFMNDNVHYWNNFFVFCCMKYFAMCSVRCIVKN